MPLPCTKHNPFLVYNQPIKRVSKPVLSREQVEKQLLKNQQLLLQNANERGALTPCFLNTGNGH
jgi:hypothetical protein